MSDRWTLLVWRLLCLLASTSALAAVMGWMLAAWAVGPALVVGMLLVIAGVHDSERGCVRSATRHG